jgi:ABC-type transport system involved in multi-copper enzyme maturation permease subunit
MRGRRAFVILTTYLALMGFLIMVVYLAYVAASTNSFGINSRQAGKVVFSAVLGVQVVLVIFIGPALTAAAIVGEKERQTYDLLRTTLLSARSLVTGKLFSALSYVYLLILISIPLQSIAFLLGGISVLELLLSQLLVVISALTFALVGLYFSTVMRSTLTASVTTFATVLFLTIGGPSLAALLLAIVGSLMFDLSTPAWQMQAALMYGGLLLAATNLPVTLVMSDLFLVDQGTLFTFTEFVDGHAVTIFSPWIPFIIIYVLAAFLLYRACIRRIKKVAR